MKEVVWIFGPSAAGKNTLIKNIQSKKNFHLIESLGWKDKRIAICAESLDLIGGAKDEQRKIILKKVPNLLRDADIVLVKWQYVDSVAKRPQALKELLPDARHRIIELRVGIEELIERLPKRDGWTDYGSERAYYEREFELIPKCLNELSEGFDRLAINSSKDGNYRLIKPRYSARSPNRGGTS